MPRQSVTPALAVRALTVTRSSTFTLNIDQLSLSAGAVVCVAGANGSGKTTFIEAVVNLLKPDTGKVLIAGQALTPSNLAAKRSLGFIPDDDSWIIPELTAQEFFDLTASVYRQAGVTTNLAQATTELAEHLLFSSFHQQIGALSHGNRKKVQLISALMHTPQLIVVDELRNGLDPIAIKRAEELLKQRAQAGAAILAATHDLWWAERFAGEVIMLRDGQAILHETTAKIIKQAGSVEAKFMSVFGAVA